MIILLPILHLMYAQVGLIRQASTNQSFVLFDWFTWSNYGLTPASIELDDHWLYTATVILWKNSTECGDLRHSFYSW